jgi:hypothetical protein
LEYIASDRELISVHIPNNEMPKIFKNEKYHENLITSEDPISCLDEILNLPLKMKTLGSLFESYATSYPFEKDTAINEILAVGTTGRLLIHESFYLWFSGYYDLHKQTLKLMMKEEGTLPVTWRYFLAIMVHSY